MTRPVCKGSWVLGSACGECERCLADAPAAARTLFAELSASPMWRPMADAPKSGVIDIAAKWWDARKDRFEVRRFCDCRWDLGDSLVNRPPKWRGVEDGWRPIAWRPVPALPPLPETAG